MKMRIEGKRAGKPAWLEWEDGEVTGSEFIVDDLEILDRVLKDKPIGLEFFEIENKSATHPEPYRVMFLCIEWNYSVPPVFDYGSTTVTTEGFPKRLRPEGAV